MRFTSIVLAVALTGLVSASPTAAQGAGNQEVTGGAEAPLTAERIIEVARERLRPPGAWRPCRLPQNDNEIIVCAPDPDANRLESPTDEALRTGQPGRDTIPRSPNVDGPGIFQGKGMKLGKDPEPPLIVDLTNVPQGLSEEEAKLVYRVEDGPPRGATAESGQAQP